MPSPVLLPPENVRAALPFGALVPEAVKAVQSAYRGVQTRGFAGVPTGLPKVDAALGGLQPGLHLIGAEPGAGKTALCLTIARNAASAHGLPVVYASFDETPERLALKVLSSRTGLIYSDVTAGRVEPSRVEGAFSLYASEFRALSFTPAAVKLQPSELAAQLKDRMQDAEKDIGLLIVDYLQPYAAAMAGAGMEFRMAVGSIALELRAIAIAAQCPVLVVSAQSRSGQGSAKMTSLRESSDLEYGADTVALLTSDEETPVGQGRYARTLTFAKNRFGPVGSTVGLVLDGRTQVVSERE